MTLGALATSYKRRGRSRTSPGKHQSMMNTDSNTPPDVRAYLAKIGRKGGKSKSATKLAAIKRNAKKGGWPKGRPRKAK
jgi:hypothetical protein